MTRKAQKYLTIQEGAALLKLDNYSVVGVILDPFDNRTPVVARIDGREHEVTAASAGRLQSLMATPEWHCYQTGAMNATFLVQR